MSKIEITDILTSTAYANTIENWLVDYENENGKGIEREHVSGAFDGMGIYAVSGSELIGGLTFRVHNDWVFLCCGFVLPEYRGQKIYSTFIRRIEQMAIEHGLYGLHVCTYTFEAPHVYEHMGFTKGAVLENLPKGNTNIDYYKPMKAVSGIENLPAKNKCTTSPVHYYQDGEPYVTIAGAEIRNHPVVEACAYLDRLEKYVIPDLQSQLAQVTAERDAAVVHGRWIEHIDQHENYCECSVCHRSTDSPLDETPYCPNCGATMDKENQHGM